MILLNAIWTDGAIHLWGQHLPKACPAQRMSDGRFVADPRDGSASHPESAPQESTMPSSWEPVSDQQLRQVVGDLWDNLLVSDARSERLTLRLPLVEGRFVSSVENMPACSVSLAPCEVETLAFAPADTIDLLSSPPALFKHDVRGTDSLRFWSKAALLVLEILAKQRFVPDVHRGQNGRFRGFWRAVVNDRATSSRLAAMIGSMPPVCRSWASVAAVVQASDLVENFLWTTVDALVRRSLEGDELAHMLHERSDEGSSLETRWLQSLVRPDPTLGGSTEDCATIWHSIQGWLSKLVPGPGQRTCRTCFTLHPPPSGRDSTEGEAWDSWSLTLHVQAVDDPEMIVDAENLFSDQSPNPLILERPFLGAREQIRSDLEQAARHFQPLARLATDDSPGGCTLTLSQAYSFLRDAVPVLEQEGFTIWLPRWWRADRPRLGMELDIRPAAGSSGVGPSMSLDMLVDYDWRVVLGDQDVDATEIAALAASKVPLVRLRGRWVEVQPGELQTAMRFIEKSRTGRMTVFNALRHNYIADELETGLPFLGLKAQGQLADLMSASCINEDVENIKPPVGFHGTLRPYQLKGLEWFRFLTRHGLGACLADDMGLGKTIQLIALWLWEREQGASVGPTLLVVPMSLVGNWQREIERFGPSLNVMVHHGLGRLTGKEFVDEVKRHDVVISTYSLIPRDLEQLSEVEWCRVALDEAQNIKNPAAKQSVAIRSLNTVHRIGLTGTPVENHLSELWSIMDFLIPGYLGTATGFRRRLAVPIERHHDAERAERLRALIRPFVLRRLKNDPGILKELPDKMEMKVFCNLTREQAALYEALVTDMLGQIDRDQGIARRGLILTALLKLKQICNHPTLFLSDGSDMGRRSGKCARLTEMLEEVVAEGDRALVFTQFRKMGDLLKPFLENTLNREVLFMHGGVPQKQRDQMVERFQRADGDVPVFLLSLKTGGLGLNLTAASHVFHFDRWWNPAVEDQATDRAHRIGQSRQLQVHKYVCIGTLEERIDAMIERKRDLADRIVGGGQEWLTELSTNALRDVFALSSEAVAED